MRSALASVANRRVGRQRSGSLSAVPPAQTSNDYIPELAATAASILYKSPLPSQTGLPIYIVNAAALPDTFDVDFDSLLPYVLARLPGEDELLSGTDYEIIFLAGGNTDSATSEKKQGPGIGWYVQAYHILSRAMRKRLKRLYIVHPRTWVRVLISVFSTTVSPKFRRKIIHISSLTALALQIPIEQLLIPPSAYLHDRRLELEIDAPYANGRRAFGAHHPLPKNMTTQEKRLPRVLRETTRFVLLPSNVVTEGLFRIPPHSILAGILKEAYERGQKYIIWKESNAVLTQPDIDPAIVNEVKLEDCYGVHLAAALIKTWYRELHEPVFPESAYAHLRSTFDAPDTKIGMAELDALVSPTSTTSPLSSVSREILVRHLLPLLHSVAAHSSKNKMTPSNLGICFAMTLVCGSNQLEDAKMTNIMRRILEAAIETWPQLRQALGQDQDAFERALEPPADLRDYEDPLEDAKPLEHRVADGEEPHQIRLTDFDDHEPAVLVRAPTLPRRPLPPPATLPSSGKDVSPPAVPKRKPPPNATVVSHEHPPRYSSLYGADEKDEISKDSLTDHETYNEIRASAAEGGVLSRRMIPEHTATTSGQKGSNDEASNTASIALKEGSSAAEPDVGYEVSSQQNAGDLQSTDLDNLKDPAENVVPEHSFRKPSMPASASRQPPKLASLAKPVYPGNQQRPLISIPSPSTTSGGPKPRVPSPGLLRRMTSFEVGTPDSERSGAGERLSAGDKDGKDALEPPATSFNKASVDNLRKIYEERLNTAQGLAKAESARKSTGDT